MQTKSYPQFQFWFIILQLELLVMLFVRSIREANVLLYIDALTKIVPWFFSLDHPNYARWIPVHLRDMVALDRTHPHVFNEFNKGNFTVKKSSNRFSAIAIDHAHEQSNACVKGDGGAVGLTENPAALRRWMVSGPEMARVISEFEATTEKKKTTDFRHHEEAKHMQVAFHRNVKSLTDVIEEMGNPFGDNSGDLLVLDSRDIANAAIVNNVRQIETLGKQQYENFVTERLVNRTKPITEPIKRNKLPLFSKPPAQEKSKAQHKVISLKNDCSLFSRLYIACQIRNGDLEEFFKHENQAFPPSLSQAGAMRSGTKSDLVHCLENLIPPQENNLANPTVTVIIIDGAAIVNMLKPGAAKTFQDYATLVFLPYITAQLRNANRVDIVWDVYFHDSLKAETRSKRVGIADIEVTLQ
ncbi:hypothetical protein QZH41_001820 [Actinostola sp. cb2023]|nr:hypothetical protein QZH41_001820 [Actinostola sp. cb2023]